MKYLLICINVRKQATWIYFIYKSWLSSIWRYICYGDCALADLIFFMTTDLYMTVVIMTLSTYLIKYNISFYDNQLIFHLFLPCSFLYRYPLYVFFIFYWNCVICFVFLSNSSVFNMKVWSLNALYVYFIFYWTCGIGFFLSSSSYYVWKSGHWMPIEGRSFWDITKTLFTFYILFVTSRRQRDIEPSMIYDTKKWMTIVMPTYVRLKLIRSTLLRLLCRYGVE